MHGNLFPPRFACSFLDGFPPSCSLESLPFLWSLPKAKGCERPPLKHPQRMSHFLKVEWVLLSSGMVTLDSPRMTASRGEGTLTKEERKQELIRRAKRAEWRGTYSVGIWWMKGILHSIPAPLSGRWATGDCPLLSLLFTWLFNRHWARCCCKWGQSLISSFLGSPSPQSPSQPLWSCFSHQVGHSMLLFLGFRVSHWEGRQ